MHKSLFLILSFFFFLCSSLYAIYLFKKMKLLLFFPLSQKAVGKLSFKHVQAASGRPITQRQSHFMESISEMLIDLNELRKHFTAKVSKIQDGSQDTFP